MNIGIIKEGKKPTDTRVPLTPNQCNYLIENKNVNIVVQSSPYRCYSDQEYLNAGIQVVNSVDDCDVLMGVKEVNISDLIPDKTYFFFSHTIKKQPYNQKLLKAIVNKNIRLIDYEVLTDPNGIRVIAFGRWAGIVGAHNGLMTYGRKSGLFELPRAYSFHDYNELCEFYTSLKLPAMVIGVTGDGRVAHGVWEVLDQCGFETIEGSDFTGDSISKVPVYVKLRNHDIFSKPSHSFDMKHFFAHPEEYISTMSRFTSHLDVLINAIYWDPKAPVFFSKNDMADPSFRIKVIADITCDIEGSIPSTLKATTIDEPFMGYNPKTGTETEPFTENSIDVMSIDNLPNELPRDASESFGQAMIDHVIDELLEIKTSNMMYKASLTNNGNLNKPYEYLRDYLNG